MANRLASETSPYLLQHAHNPVDWYPWGAEAFERARRENRPVLLSVGYSACHWCHVMERESFEDPETARVMNELFVNVKVDREERPDVDDVYMTCVQLLTGHGGWPMTVFLTPAAEPFYAGSYFPPEDRHGLPAFRKVLGAISTAYRKKGDEVRKSADQLIAALGKVGAAGAPADALDASLPERAADELSRAYDASHGGIGRSPKFPNPMVFELFLDVAAATGRERFLEMTRNTLLRMAAGGIRDQLGGGFHRYSVDEQWLVPHFEKMLYDNAQLASLAVSAWKLSGDKRLLRIADDVLGYLLREMHSPEGGFYATQDADSEGVEGKFFVWTPEEVSAVLETKTAEIFCRVYDVTDVGNFEGANILHRTIDDEQAGRLLDRPPAEVARLLADSRRKLFEVRELRIKPFSDEKILLAWNGLTISALAAAHGATGEPRYLGAAGDAVAFVESALVSRPDGRLLHATKDGRAEVFAFLDDVAAWGLARLDLFETVFEPTDLEAARHIALDMLDAFEDREQGGFYFTAEDHKPLISRTRPVHDGALPSGTSLAVRLCLRLARWTGDERLLAAGERTLRILQQAMAENPFGFPGLLRELSIHLRPGREIIITAPGGAVGAAPLLKPLRGRYAPSDLVLAFDPARPPPVLPEMLEGRRPIDDRPTAYVCRGFSCSAPVTAWDDLDALLQEPR